MEYTIQKSLNNTSMIIVNARINDSSMNFIIDTGSVANVIFDSTYQNMIDSFEKSEKSIGIYGIEGKGQICPDVITKLIFDRYSSTTHFNVMNASQLETNFLKFHGIKIHGILGMQFLRDNNCIIDFANSSIKIGG